MKLNYLSKLSSTLFNQNSNETGIDNSYTIKNARKIHKLLITKVSQTDGEKLKRLTIKTKNERSDGDYTISINESYNETFVVYKKGVNDTDNRSFVITSIVNENYASILLDFFIVYIAVLSNDDTVLSEHDKKGYFDMNLMNTVMLLNDLVHSILLELIKSSYIPFQSIKPDAFSSFYQPVNDKNALDPLLQKPIHDRFVKNQLSKLIIVVYDNKNSNDHGEDPSLHGTVNSRVFKDKILQMSMEYDNLVDNRDNIDIDRIYYQNYHRLQQTEKIWSSSSSSLSYSSTLTDDKKGYLNRIQSYTMAPHHDNDEYNQLFEDWNESAKIHEEEEINDLKSDYIHYFNDLDYNSDSCSIYEFSGEVFSGDDDDNNDIDELYI